MRLKLCLFFLFCLIARESFAEPIHIGLSSRVPNVNEEHLQRTISTLKEKFKDEGVVVKTYSLPGLEQAIKEDKLDIVHSSAGLYRRLSSEGLRDLVALASPRFPDPNHSEGTAFIVKAERKDLQTIADLKGKTLAANSATGFSGYQIGKYEILKNGYDPEKFFSKEIFVGEQDKMKNVLEAVKSGKAEVGFLRLCYLEDMAKLFGYDPKEFRVIGDRKNQNLSCSYSTDLFPSWTISTTTRISPEKARAILVTLLDIKPSSTGVMWSPASDYQSVDTLFKELKIGPWAYLREWTVRRVWNEYWPWFMLFCTCLVVLVIHSVRTEKLVRKRTEQLEEAHQKQTHFLHMAKEASERLEKMQKIGALDQMSSLLAHEIRQPIATIELYGRGLSRFVEGGTSVIKENSNKIHNAVKLINQQCQKINNIVERVRTYAKTDKIRRSPTDLKDVTANAVNNFVLSKQKNPDVVVDATESVFVSADKLELELVIVNLLRNAADATNESGQNTPIHVCLSKSTEEAVLVISDTAKEMSPEDLHKLSVPLASSKEQGFGLGLQIVRSIVEAHGGKIIFSPNQPRGLCVTIKLPLIPMDAK